MNEGLFIYEKYFFKRWTRSISKKLSYFPELNFAEDLAKVKTLETAEGVFDERQADEIWRARRIRCWLGRQTPHGPHLVGEHINELHLGVKGPLKLIDPFTKSVSFVLGPRQPHREGIH